MVSIISAGASLIPRPGNEDSTIRAPLEGPGGLLEAIAAARKDPASALPVAASVDGEDDATRVLSAHVSARPSSAPPREDEATRVLSAVEQTKLAATAEQHETPKAPVEAPPGASGAAPEVAKEPQKDAAPKAASAEEARPRRRSLTQEVTSKTRIVVRPPAAQKPPAAPASSGLLRVLLLMVAAGAGGFIFSQVMNARRARTVHVVAPTSAPLPARLPTPIDGGVRGGERLSRPPGP